MSTLDAENTSAQVTDDLIRRLREATPPPTFDRLVHGDWFTAVPAPVPASHAVGHGVVGVPMRHRRATRLRLWWRRLVTRDVTRDARLLADLNDRSGL
ncbi:hypothetical protein [Agromyces aureus]|nr:hypothetical protein [Agromyces aureus]